KGLTEREVRPALKALDELWQMLPALSKLLDEVNERYRNLPFFGMSDELFQIQKLIEGESIEIIAKTTYEQRGLLTPDEITKAATPLEILQAMAEGYDRAKAVVVRVKETVGRLLNQLNQAAGEVSALRALADSLNEPVSELQLLEAKVAAFREGISSDPLSLADGVDQEILSVIDPLRQRLKEIEAERARLDNEISAAVALLVSLEEAFTYAKATYDERVLKVMVENPDSLPALFPVSVIDELKNWLDRLGATLRHGRWQAAKVGFGNWKAQL